VEDPVVLIEKDVKFFSKFTHVIANGLPEKSLLKLSNELYSTNVALFVVKSVGLIGYFRTVVPEHTVVQAKPDNPTPDLRINDPFPELEAYCSKFDITKLKGEEYSHLPFVIVLINELKKWRNDNGGKDPKTSDEKKQFRQRIEKLLKANTENIEEALKHTFRAYTVYSISSEVKNTLNDPKAKTTDSKTPPFWIMARAVAEFYEKEKKLPLEGSIPDMTATTDGYIALQRIYAEKANKDVQVVSKRVKDLLTSVMRDSNEISEEQIKLFCKNSHVINCLRFRKIEDEIKSPKTDTLGFQLPDNTSSANWYVVLRASDIFFENHKKNAGSSNDQMEKDTAELISLSESLLKNWGIDSSNVEYRKYAQELVRFGGSELHTIASFIGGLASQEIIKVITHQYLPLNNTYIFNGVNSSSVSMEL